MVIRMVHESWPKVQKDISYSDDSSLNTLEICIPKELSGDPNQIWVVFIHGGAWLDPEIDASSFDKTQTHLLASPEIKDVAGLASINYRLSSNASHPRKPSNPSDPARNAKHPDHIRDVLAALLHLQTKYGFEDRYILVGHSCGATLALQVAMKRYWGAQYESTLALELNVVPPVAILGVEGLYDLPALVKYHHDEPTYKGFVTNAFGSDESSWTAVSTTQGAYNESWTDGKLVILAQSHGDELVEWEQVQLMYDVLKKQGWKDDSEASSRKLKLIELTGKHDEVWEETSELARAIEFTIRETMKLI